MLGGLLAAAVTYGVQQAGNWLQTPAGRRAVQTYGPMALMEIAKKMGWK